MIQHDQDSGPKHGRSNTEERSNVFRKNQDICSRPCDEDNIKITQRYGHIRTSECETTLKVRINHLFQVAIHEEDND